MEYHDNLWIKISSNNYMTKITSEQWKTIFIWLQDLHNEYERFALDYHKNDIIKETIEVPPYIFLLTVIQLFIYYSSKIKIEKLDQIQYYLFAIYTLVAALLNDVDFLQKKHYLYQFIISGNWLKSNYSDVKKVYDLQRHLLIYFNYDFFNISTTLYYLINFKYFISNELNDDEINDFIEYNIEYQIETIYNNDIYLILENDPFQLISIIIDRIYITK